MRRLFSSHIIDDIIVSRLLASSLVSLTSAFSPLYCEELENVNFNTLPPDGISPQNITAVHDWTQHNQINALEVFYGESFQPGYNIIIIILKSNY